MVPKVKYKNNTVIVEQENKQIEMSMNEAVTLAGNLLGIVKWMQSPR